ncbi:MAG: hypothetical protein ACLQU4_22640 [Limisphaerales bacterium]
MSKRISLLAVGILVTLLLLLILLVVAKLMGGYVVTNATSILFPYAGAEMYIKQLGDYDSLGMPTLSCIFLAVVQYPIYGWLLGGALDRKGLKTRSIVILVCHVSIGTTLLFLCLY